MRIPGSAEFWGTRRAGVVVLGLLTLAVFGDLLFVPGDAVVSLKGADTWRQFVGWRHFGFEQMRQGNFPLWNPYVYSGSPYFGGVQSALLYPPNHLHLFLPLAKAINWGAALHVWWLGTGMFLWMRAAGLRQVSSLFAAVILMFSGPFYLHLFAGHLTNLGAMAWMPWILLCIGRWRIEMDVRWVLSGALAAAMQILAGHPQYVYYGAIASTLYAGTHFFSRGPGRWRFAAGFGAIYGAAALLAAAQLLPGIEAAGESVRGEGVGKELAGTFSFSPENLVTALAPAFFGDWIRLGYWGKWHFWEMSAFFGVTGAWCAAIGVVRGRGAREWPMAIVGCAGCFVLALGKYSPLFDALHAAVPGFGLFRGNGKFIFYAVLFAAALAGMGLDVLARREKATGGAGLVAFGAGLAALLAGAGFLIARAGGDPVGAWAAFRGWLWDPMEVLNFAEPDYFSGALSAASASHAAKGLLLAGAVLLAAVLCTAFHRRRRFAVPLLAVLGAAEMAGFASAFRESFALADLLPAYQVRFREKRPGDYRAMDVTRENAGLLSGIPDVWGEDPGVLERYAEFMAATQNVVPDAANQNLRMKFYHRNLGLLRVKYLFDTSPRGTGHREFEGDALGRFEFIPAFAVVKERDERFVALFGKNFDPRATVILEEEPRFRTPPGGGAVHGRATVRSEDTDEVVVDVEVDGSCVLLMTDPYAEGWRIENLSGDPPQEAYAILPANHVLRGIPLEGGEHRLRLFYRPRSFSAGLAISAGASLAWVCAWCLRGRGARPVVAVPGEPRAAARPRPRPARREEPAGTP